MKGASKWCEFPLGCPTIITSKRWHVAHALNDCGVARTMRTTPEKYLHYGGMVMSGA